MINFLCQVPIIKKALSKYAARITVYSPDVDGVSVVRLSQWAAFGKSRVGIGEIKDKEGRVSLAYRKFKLVYNNSV